MKHVTCIMVALAVTSVVAANPTMPTFPPGQNCVVVDMWGHFDDTTKAIQEMSKQIFGDARDPAWLKDVRICRAGGLVVWMPADGGSEHILIFGADGRAITVDAGDVWVFEKSMKMIASMRDENRDGVFDFVDYYRKPTPPDGTVEVWDRGGDGCPDWKFAKDPSGSIQQFVSLAGRWCEFKKQKGKYGFVVDGKFYPTQEAKGVAIEKSLNECAQSRSATAN